MSLDPLRHGVRAMRLAMLALLLAAPRAVGACASCMSSASGDQTYNWAYFGLMLTPFGLLLGVGGVLTGCYLSARRRPAARTDPTLDEETS